MGYQHKKSELIPENLEAKRENLQKENEASSLKDMPLEDRRKDAKKPLFLSRYE